MRAGRLGRPRSDLDRLQGDVRRRKAGGKALGQSGKGDRYRVRNRTLSARVWQRRPGSQRGARLTSRLERARLSSSYQASMQGRLRCVRGSGFGTDRRPAMIQWRVSAGSITSSISSTEAIEVALPLAYNSATLA